MSEVDPQSLQGKPPEEASTTEPRSNADVTQKSNMKQQTTREPKGIFVCCDGTGNEFAAKNSLDGNSNVVKLYTALKLDNSLLPSWGWHPGRSWKKGTGTEVVGR